MQSDAADVDGKTPLHWMCASDDPACAKVLTKFDKKVVNSRDNALRTALHMSVAEGKLGTVEVLLKVSTCDVNPQVCTAPTWGIILLRCQRAGAGTGSERTSQLLSALTTAPNLSYWK